MPDKSFLDDALDFCSRETQHVVADALACHLHNTGYQLEGNTEANDIEWFASNLWARYTHSSGAAWNRASDEQRRHWSFVARTVLEILPSFQERVAHRLIALSKVTRDIERSLRRPPSPAALTSTEG